MREPKWLDGMVVRVVHQRLLAEHAGALGLRDEGLLESALARPRQFWTYETGCSVERLAAVYASSVARNHPYADGNKRLALVVMLLFLDINGVRIHASEEDLCFVMLRLAEGDLTEDELTAWLEERSRA